MTKNFSCFPEMNFSKKGVSVILGYVLLIVLGVSLATIVFIWLRDYVSPSDVGKCPEDVSLIIESVECDDEKGILNITLKNKGLFSINGTIIRVNDNRLSDLGLYSLGIDNNDVLKDGSNFTNPLKPNGKVELLYNFGDVKDAEGNLLEFIALVDAQPFVIDKGRTIYCERVSNVDVDCVLTIIQVSE